MNKMAEFKTIITNVEALKMNKPTNTEKRVLSIVKNHLELDDISLNNSFIDTLDCDSISTIEILMLIEDDFSIEIEDDLFTADSYEHFTLAQLVLIVDDKLAA